MNKLTLPLSVAKLIESIGDRNNFKSSEIVELIRNANIQEKDLRDWSDFSHPVQEGYGRKLMYKTEHFEILVISWATRDISAIHNHGYTQWGAVKSFGRLEHSIFNLNGGHLTTEMRQKLNAGDVIAVNQELIHQMGNPFNKNTLSLHVYGTSQKVEGITDRSQIFEIGKGEVQLADGGVFYDLPASQIAIANNELTTDRLTLIGHYTNLLSHYYKLRTKSGQYKKAVNFFHDRSFESRLISELDLDNKSILYLIELKRARYLLNLLGESTATIDAILKDINDPDTLS